MKHPVALILKQPSTLSARTRDRPEVLRFGGVFRRRRGGGACKLPWQRHQRAGHGLVAGAKRDTGVGHVPLVHDLDAVSCGSWQLIWQSC